MVKHLDMGEIDINKALPIPLGTELPLSCGNDFKYVVMTT